MRMGRSPSRLLAERLGGEVVRSSSSAILARQYPQLSLIHRMKRIRSEESMGRAAWDQGYGGHRGENQVHGFRPI